MRNYLESRLSYYKDIKDVQSRREINFNGFIDLLTSGDHIDTVKEVRAFKTVKNSKSAKSKKECLPLVTLSGTFFPHNDVGLREHSGLICLDFDGFENEIELNEIKEKVSIDAYSLLVFTSAGGNLAVVVKINPDKHLDSFNQLGEHFYKTYGLVVDQSGKNVSRYRYLSYDPDHVLNEVSTVFEAKEMTHLPTKEMNGKVTNADFEVFVGLVESQKLDITTEYHDWIKIGYGIANQFNGDGLGYFDRLSRFNPSYNQSRCIEQYNSILSSIKSNKGDKKESTLKTVLYIAKLRGFVPPKPNNGEVSIFSKDQPLSIRVKNYLQDNFTIKTNVLSNRAEVNGIQVTDSILNDLWLMASESLWEDIPINFISQVLDSGIWEKYHPIKLYFETNPTWDGEDRIKVMSDALNSETPELAYKYLKCFLIGMVHMVYGTPNHLIITLIGKQGTGKTVFAKNLLPKKLQEYFAESHLSSKDIENTMNQNLLVLDDEFIGLNKMGADNLKSLVSTTLFKSTRKYEKYESTLPRLASIITASNREDVLEEAENRRILPISLGSKMDFETLNRIDRNQLFAQIYRYYLDGVSWQLLDEDQKELNEHGRNYWKEIPEFELVNKYFRKPNANDTSIDIQYVNSTTAMQKISELGGIPFSAMKINKIGEAFKHHGFEKRSKKIGRDSIKAYEVVLTVQDPQNP